MADTKIQSSEITPEHIYFSYRLNRRQFLKGMATLGAGALLAAACGPLGNPTESVVPTDSANGVPGETQPAKEDIKTDELGDPVNTYEEITNYNNYYEFTTSKEGVAKSSKDFKTSPWEVEVTGLVGKPGTYGLEDILKKYTQEERIYRLRCVEAWSMVIPWVGFPLSQLLKEAEPMGNANYVRFVSILDPDQMPGQRQRTYPWPYQEGLRMDEAMHDLTMLVTGLYGKPLPPQDGAPLRLVVPWKYGFKGIKAIVKIDLVESQPETLWSTIAPGEYGFYANVNPKVDHPRWSQASERRIGEFKRRETLMFNGYEDQVASLYSGMDLRENY